MREVINISLPTAMAKSVKQDVKAGGYASTSEFFRDLLRDWQERKTLRELKKSEVEFKLGRGHYLKSLKDLR